MNDLDTPTHPRTDRMISDLRAENIVTWFDLGLFIDRLREDRRAAAQVKGNFAAFKRRAQIVSRERRRRLQLRRRLAESWLNAGFGQHRRNIAIASLLAGCASCVLRWDRIAERGLKHISWRSFTLRLSGNDVGQIQNIIASFSLGLRIAERVRQIVRKPVLSRFLFSSYSFRLRGLIWLVIGDDFPYRRQYLVHCRLGSLF